MKTTLESNRSREQNCNHNKAQSMTVKKSKVKRCLCIRKKEGIGIHLQFWQYLLA